jgi:hypothetical protein
VASRLVWPGPPSQGLGWLSLWDTESQGFALGCPGLPRWGARRTSPGSCTETAFGMFRFACIHPSTLWLGGFVAFPVPAFAGMTGLTKPRSLKAAKGKHGGARAAMFDPVLSPFASWRLERSGREHSNRTLQ